MIKSPITKKITKNIIILTNTLKSGGAEKQSIYLTQALSSDFKVQLIIYYGDQFDERMLHLLDKYQHQAIFLHGNHLLKLIRLYKLFKADKSAIIFSFLATTNFINAVIGWAAKVHWRIGGIRTSRLSKFKEFIQKFLHNNLLTLTVFNNYDGMNKLCQKGFLKHKAVVIHNCIDIKQPPREKKIIRDNIQMISVGRFVKAKDFFTALKSFQILLSMIQKKNYTTRVSFLIIGYGPLENEIRKYVSELQLDNHVKIIINPVDISHYLAESDIYLSTSLFEGLSNSIMEAMEFSLPVVATDVGDNKELIVSGRNGFLTKLGDVADISAKLLKLIEDDKLRIQMGLNSYGHLRDNFSMDKFKQKYIELIENLINEKKS